MQKKTFSGDHHMLAPRNARTGQLIHPGAMSPEMLETWEADTHSLQGLGAEPSGVAHGPYLPEQAGYHDAVVRRSNLIQYGPDEGSLKWGGFPENLTAQTFSGPWVGTYDYARERRSDIDPSTDVSAGGISHMVGDYRAGGLHGTGLSVDSGSEDSDRSFTVSYARNTGNAAAYAKGVSKARKALPKPPEGPVSRNPVEPQDYERS